MLLKVQPGKAPDAGAISVVYDARAGVVRVSALRVGARAWTLYPTTAATLAGGDVLGARVLTDGTVEGFQNGDPLTAVTLSSADRAFFDHRGGKIGIWTVGSPGSVLDDVGGGTTVGG